MGGGRSAPQQTVTTSGIDEEFKPYLEEVLADVTQRYKDTRGDPRFYSSRYDTSTERCISCSRIFI